MKKVLSIVLSLSMVLGSFGLAFAATPNVASKFSDVNGKNCEEAVKVLSDLNVVTGYDDGTYKPENIVTRAEMAVLVVNALGLQNYVTTNAKSTFKDMDNYGWAEGYIAYAQQLGIISGYGDGTFKPGKTVSYDEASTMLVAALGYTPASLQGTWPANYVTKAKSLGILDDVKAGSDGANRGDTAIMLYQTLTQKIGIVNKDNVWKETEGKQISVPGFKDKQNAGDKMIYRLGADPDQTRIDTVVTGDEDSNIKITPYIGMCGTEYFKDGKIIAITDIQSTFIKGSFSGTDIASFSGDDDVDYTISLPHTSNSSHSYDSWDQVQYFYNGQTATKDQLTKLGFVFDSKSYPTQLHSVDSNGDASDVDATIAVKDNGKTIKTLYSVSIWDHTADGKATDADLNSIKNDKSLLGYDFTTLKDGSIDLNSFDLIGVPSLDKIAKDNVVFVYTKKDNGDITRVEVSQDTVQGEIAKVKTNDKGENTKYTIDGKTYSFTGDNHYDYGAGDSIKAYLDPDGKIYAVDDVSSTANNYAIVLKAPQKDGAFNFSVKLFTKDGNQTVYNLKDEATFRKTLVTSDGELSGPSKFAGGELVTYDLNSAGQITKMEDRTHSGSLHGKVNNGVVNGMQLADNAVIFTVSGDAGKSVDSWSFDVISPSNIDKDEDISSSKSPSIAGKYATTSNGNKVSALIIDSNASGASNSYGFIDSVATVKNKKGDTVKEVTAFIDGKEVTAQTDTNGAYEAMSGDLLDDHSLYRFEFNGDIITNIAKETNFWNYGDVPSDKIIKDQVMIYDSGYWNKVSGVDGTNLKVARVATDRTPGYISVKGATAYQAVLDGSSFDHWKLGNASNINKDYYVVMFQVSKNSSAPDLIVYVDRADAQKLNTSKFNFQTTADTGNGDSTAAYSFDNGKASTIAPVKAGISATATVTKAAVGATVTVTVSGTPTASGIIAYTLDTGNTSDWVAVSGLVSADDMTSSNGKGTAKVEIDGSTVVSDSIVFTINNSSRKDFKNLKLTAELKQKAAIAVDTTSTSSEVVAGVTALTRYAGSPNAYPGDEIKVPVTFSGTIVTPGAFTVSLIDGSSKVIGAPVTVTLDSANVATKTADLKFTVDKAITGLKLKLVGPEKKTVTFTDSIFKITAPDGTGDYVLNIGDQSIQGYAGATITIPYKFHSDGKVAVYGLSADKVALAGDTTVITDNSGLKSGNLTFVMPSNDLSNVSIKITVK